MVGHLLYLLNLFEYSDVGSLFYIFLTISDFDHLLNLIDYSDAYHCHDVAHLLNLFDSFLGLL